MSLIEEIESSLKSGNPSMMKDSLEKALEELKKHQWISVEDEWPKEDGYYVAFSESYGRYIVNWNKKHGFIQTKDSPHGIAVDYFLPQRIIKPEPDKE